MVANQYKEKDEQLFAEVQKLMNGNYDSYQNVYELSKKYIYKIINDIVQNHHTTEDMMQETYLQIYNKIGTLRDARSFYVWAGRIASNLTLRHLQKYRKEFIQSASGEDEEDFMFDKIENDHEAFIPETVLENEEQQRIIAGILDSLSPEQKLTVQYYYFEELSVGDIANLMECSTGTVKSRLNYARKSLKTAVNKFEKTNDVKLYSISSLPVFFIVFRAVSEGILVPTGGAVVAGGVIAQNAVTGGGSIGTAGGSVAASAEAGSVAGVGAGSVASAGTGSVAAAGSAATAGSTAAATAGTGFLTTMAGKVTIIVATVVIGTGTATTSAAVSENNLINSGRYEEVMTQVDIVKKANEIEGAQNLLFKNMFGESVLEEQESDTSADAIYELMGDSYDNVDTYVDGMDEEYLTAINNLSAAMLRYEEALEYSLTPEQLSCVDALMEGYITEVDDYLEMGQGYTMLLAVDTSGNFANNYYPRIIDILERETIVIDGFATIYSKEEVKTALAKHSVSELQEILQMGGGVGDLIAYDLSENTLNELLYYSEQSMGLLQDIQVLTNEMMSDPALSQYVQ